MDNIPSLKINVSAHGRVVGLGSANEILRAMIT